MKRLNKKGILVEGIFMLVIIFVFVLLTYFGLKLMNEFNSAISPVVQNSGNATYIIEKGIDVYGIFDTVFIILLIGLFLSIGTSMFYIRTHPIYFVIAIFALIITILFSVIFSNIFEQTITNSQLGNETTFTIIPIFMNNLPTVTLIMIALFAIILYAKSRTGGEFT